MFSTSLFAKRMPIVFVGWLFVVLALSFSMGGASAEAPSNSATATVTTADSFYLQKINTLRNQKGLPPLALLPELDESAVNKAADMVANSYFEHYAPNGGPSFKDFIWTSVPKATLIGENLARCYVSRQQAFDALVASRTHYAIMVGDYRYFGVSEAYDYRMRCSVLVMHFARV